MLNSKNASVGSNVFYLVIIVISLTSLVYPFLYPPLQTASDEIKAEVEIVAVKIIVNQSTMPVFSKMENVVEKKKAFFAYLLPDIHRQNAIIQEDRDYILDVKNKIDAGTEASASDINKIHGLAKQYRVDSAAPMSSMLHKLLRKVDVIPAALVLMQAANESAWGTSRFARQGYNFFGLWCFNKGCGFVPNRRNDDAEHEVKKFKNLTLAVKTYLSNLNAHPAYKELRDIRYQLRQNNNDITAEKLVQGLELYSERGQDYIDELLQMLRFNRKFMEL